MKSGNGPTGDGDEEEGKNRRRSLGVPVKGRGDDLERASGILARWSGSAKKRGRDQSQHNQSQSGEKLQAVDIIAGLKEAPDRQD